MWWHTHKRYFDRTIKKYISRTNQGNGELLLMQQMLPGNFFLDMILICMEKKNTGIHREKNEEKKKTFTKSYVRITEHRHLFCSVDILWVSQIFFSDYELIPRFRNLILSPKKQNSWCWLCPKSCLWLLSELMETRAEFWVIPLREVLRFLAVKGSPATWVRPLQSEWWLLRGPGFVCERRSSDSFL